MAKGANRNNEARRRAAEQRRRQAERRRRQAEQRRRRQQEQQQRQRERKPIKDDEVRLRLKSWDKDLTAMVRAIDSGPSSSSAFDPGVQDRAMRFSLTDEQIRAEQAKTREALKSGDLEAMRARIYELRDQSRVPEDPIEAYKTLPRKEGGLYVPPKTQAEIETDRATRIIRKARRGETLTEKQVARGLGAVKSTDDLQALIAAGPSGMASKMGAPIGGKYLGTADGAPKPQYFDGFQWTPATKPTNEIYSLQVTLRQLGLLGDFQRGVWDRNSANAFEIVLEAANASGLTWEQMIDKMSAEGAGLDEYDPSGGGGGGGGSTGPLPPSPMDIEALGHEAAQKVMGRNLRPEEVPMFEQAFRSVYGNGTGDGVFDAPSPDVLADRALRSVVPVETEAGDLVGAYDTFLQAISGTPMGTGRSGAR